MDDEVGTAMMVGPVGRRLHQPWSWMAYSIYCSLLALSIGQYTVQALYRWLQVCRGRRMPIWLYVALQLTLSVGPKIGELAADLAYPVPDPERVRNPLIGPALGFGPLPPPQGFARRARV